jgi:hypothetical protein
MQSGLWNTNSDTLNIISILNMEIVLGEALLTPYQLAFRTHNAGW